MTLFKRDSDPCPIKRDRRERHEVTLTLSRCLDDNQDYREATATLRNGNIQRVRILTGGGYQPKRATLHSVEEVRRLRDFLTVVLEERCSTRLEE